MSVPAEDWMPRARRLAEELIAAGKLWSAQWREAIMAWMLQALDLSTGQRVLEIGTGTGYNAALLCHRLGEANVASIDIDPTLVGQA